MTISPGRFGRGAAQPAIDEDLAMNDAGIGVPILVRPESEADSLRMLVVIASYGEKNLRFLKEIIAEYRGMALQVDIVVLSNAAKSLGSNVDVRVGIPTRNPWSLELKLWESIPPRAASPLRNTDA